MVVEGMGGGVSPLDSRCQEKLVAHYKKLEEHLVRRERGGELVHIGYGTAWRTNIFSDQ